MGETTFIILIASCIHCMFLSFSLQTNKIQYRLYYGFTEEAAWGGEQGIWQEAGDLEFSLRVLLPEQALMSLNFSFLICKMKLLSSTNARASHDHNGLHSYPIDKTLLKHFLKISIIASQR